MKVIYEEGQRIPVKLWLDDIEDGALKQAINLSKLPFAFKHIAIMPDSHQGYGMPIGGVMATRGVVVPNAVGVDIGCGMCATRIANLYHISIEDLKKIMGVIRERIPVGFDHHKDAVGWDGFDRAPDVQIIQKELTSSRKQLGTLGGGNHFIEIQKGNDDNIWIMLHSGSRNFGFKIAHEYHKTAQALCARWFSELPDPDLAFLPIETREAKEYLCAMNYALEFARENRRRMMIVIQEVINQYINNTEFDEMIDIHHNYAVWENHYGTNVIVHRKGATSAREGQIGIIPGSQGTKSYIVRGRGNSESFMSCSHGAGRRMGRKAAQHDLNLEDEKRKLDEMGIIHSVRTINDLDEAPGAYKDIDVVMENQKDLVETVVELTPLGVIKG